MPAAYAERSGASMAASRETSYRENPSSKAASSPDRPSCPSGCTQTHHGPVSGNHRPTYRGQTPDIPSPPKELREESTEAEPALVEQLLAPLQDFAESQSDSAADMAVEQELFHSGRP